jgi:hypothetical protein
VTAGWDRYAGALADLHAARRAVAAEQRGDAERRAARRAQVHELAAALVEQGGRLAELARQVRAPLPADHAAPLPVEPLPWDAAAAEATARVAAADAAVTEAHRVARLPQLLPDWSGDLGRAAVVYLGFVLPNLVPLVLLSVAGVHENAAAAFWFVVVWPLVTAVGGAIVIGRVSRPRIAPEDDPDAVPSPATRRRTRRYPWLGVLLAWLGWFVPGWLLDRLAELTTG